MSLASESEASTPLAADLQRVAELLGGRRVLRHTVNNALDAHEMLVEGLPGQALSHLLDNLLILKMTGPLERALGMSLRTFQRRKETPGLPLSLDQSGRAWKFAEILAKATSVFGRRQDAERWLERPAAGLDQRRPLDLLATPAGLELVEALLERLE
jgi:putative toxin-antitoxin system antitoxin component (TIGR02293 family)